MPPNQETPLRSISSGAAKADKKADPDKYDILEEDTLEGRRYKVETDTIRQRNRDRRANRVLRGNYAKNVFRYLIFYSVFVAFVLLLAGFKVCGFRLSEDVLFALVGSTAVSAIGLVATVVAGLFTFAKDS